MPTQAEIKKLRQEAGLTTKEAARLVYVTEQTWQRWEGQTRRETEMPAGYFALFMMRLGKLKPDSDRI